MARGFTTIQDWMLDLDLDIYEVIILAVIYGFSQDGDSRFTGSQNYLAKKAKCSRRKVVNCLENLLNKGYIQKYDVNVRGIHLCEYTFKQDAQDAQVVNDMHRGCECGAHNNIDENINKNIDINKDKRFVPPTIEQVREYCLSRNNGIDPEAFVAHYTSNGWMVGKAKMKDWKSAVITWEKSRSKERKVAPKERKKSVTEYNLKAYDEMFGTNFHEQTYGKREVYDEQ